MGDRVHSIQATSGGDNGAFNPATKAITLSSPGGSVIYEVMAAQGNEIDWFTIPVTVNNTGSAGNSPGVYSTVVSATYAPTTTEFSGLNGALVGIPQFADTSTSIPFATMAACHTTLLIPYVTNTNGFDTGVEIANTSARTDGTPAQTGGCTLTYYGAAGGVQPAPQETPQLPAGSIFKLLVSSETPGFDGYMVADCGFEYAHGMEFVSDLGLQKVAWGIPVIVLPATSTRIDTAGQ